MFYKLFRDGLPDYLVRHYWWAYLWRVSVWFFDHQIIINAILFGQYGRLMRRTLTALDHAPNDSVLQLTCVYGSLTPNILQRISPHCLHLTDVAPVQLRLAVQKIQCKTRLLSTRMNAESLGYKSNSFTTVIIFFLLHELPVDARLRALNETFRVLAPGGRLIIVEYASLPSQHFLYRFFLSRYLLTKYEPFLDKFWREDLNSKLQDAAKKNKKSIKQVSSCTVFSKFYRLLEYDVNQ